MAAEVVTHIARVLAVSQVDVVPELVLHRENAGMWLNTWTPNNNFDAIIVLDNNYDEALKRLALEMVNVARSQGFQAGNFELDVGFFSVVKDRVDLGDYCSNTRSILCNSVLENGA